MENNIIVKKSLEFAINIIRFVELLEKEKKYVIANQLLKSGTSIGANIKEAQNAESKNDFIHKFKLAAKEIEETEYWLTLCELAESYPSDNTLKFELLEIRKIVGKIISSAKKNN